MHSAIYLCLTAVFVTHFGHVLFVLFAQHPAKWHPALCPGLLRAEIAQVHNACAPRSAGAVPEPCVLSAEAQHCTWDTGSASWLCLGRTGRVRREVSKQNPTKRSVRSAQLGLHGILGSTASQSYHKKAPSKGRAAQAGTNTPPLSRRPCPGLSLSAGGPGCAQHPLPAARPRGPHSRALPGSGLRPAARAGPLPAERRCPRSRQPGQWPRAAPPPAGAALGHGHGRAPLLPPRRLSPPLGRPQQPPRRPGPAAARSAEPEPRRSPAANLPPCAARRAPRPAGGRWLAAGGHVREEGAAAAAGVSPTAGGCGGGSSSAGPR